VRSSADERRLLRRPSTWISLKRSHLHESVVGDHSSLTRLGDNSEIHHHYGATAGVPLKLRHPSRHWLPSTHDRCVGRDEALKGIWQEAHGVELNGPFGIGRTPLARHAAHMAKERWEAVYYTDRAEAVGEWWSPCSHRPRSAPWSSLGNGDRCRLQEGREAGHLGSGPDAPRDRAPLGSPMMCARGARGSRLKSGAVAPL
jgi:hypothetical protein